MPKVTVCENFVCAAYDGSVTTDQFVKERLSFIEIAFRKKEEEISRLNSSLNQDIANVQLRVLAAQRSAVRMPGTRASSDAAQREVQRQVQRLKESNAGENKAFRASCAELNVRFKQAGGNLNYHNGFIQISQDEQMADQIEGPFWELVSAPKWKHVDDDMKEAIDRRDNAGRDPAWHASKALESTIKIISDAKGWTHGKENGPINYVENLGATKNGNFIADWERDSLCWFFSNVRRLLAHGSDSDPMPNFTTQQTDWAIEFCMIWIKSLIQRS